jgi:hypothetical protein
MGMSIPLVKSFEIYHADSMGSKKKGTKASGG